MDIYLLVLSTDENIFPRGRERGFDDFSSLLASYSSNSLFYRVSVAFVFFTSKNLRSSSGFISSLLSTDGNKFPPGRG